jgi:hypothetical protein
MEFWSVEKPFSIWGQFAAEFQDRDQHEWEVVPNRLFR